MNQFQLEPQKLTSTQVSKSEMASEIILQLKKNNLVVKAGIARYPELDAKGYQYHNSEHAENVLKTCVTLLLIDGANPTDKNIELIAIAAVFHDLGFIYQQAKNEPVGARIAREAMKGYYTEDEIQKVEIAILDTEMKPVPDGGLKQFATEDNLLSKVICDSDTFNFGTEKFFENTIKVYNEIFTDQQVSNMSQLGTAKNGIEFMKQSLRLLDAHDYYTKTGRCIAESGKIRNRKILSAYIDVCLSTNLA